MSEYDLAYKKVSSLPVVASLDETTDFILAYDTSAQSPVRILANNALTGLSNSLVPAGSALSVTVADHAGATVLLNTAAGSTVTLPAATGTGAIFKFVVSTTATSNSHIVKVADSTDLIHGFVDILDLDGATISGYKANGTDHDTITMNRTTTGGIIGDYIEVQDIATNVYVVTRGKLTCVTGSNPATPFSATVS